MNISPAGIGFIKAQEALELIAYKDQAGVWTIGYGHTGADVTPDQRISIDQADELLNRDLVGVQSCINNCVNAPITQSQFDALCSFVFNEGCLAFRGSTLLRKLNEGDDEGASNEFKKWIYIHVDGKPVQDAGLEKRREQEMEMFLA